MGVVDQNPWLQFGGVQITTYICLRRDELRAHVIVGRNGEIVKTLARAVPANRMVHILESAVQGTRHEGQSTGQRDKSVTDQNSVVPNYQPPVISLRILARRPSCATRAPVPSCLEAAEGTWLAFLAGPLPP